jgi:hypothetical protein
VTKEHVFAHAKHETLSLSQWKQNHPKQHNVTQFIPHHENNEKGRSPSDLKVNHKCNKSTQMPKDGGSPTWCATQKKKHLTPYSKTLKGSIKKCEDISVGVGSLCPSQYSLKCFVYLNDYIVITYIPYLVMINFKVFYFKLFSSILQKFILVCLQLFKINSSYVIYSYFILNYN